MHMKRIASALLALTIAANASAATKLVPANPVVNVNTATVQQLSYLPGVGPKTAEAIVAYRAIRPFGNKADLMNVKGIKQAKLAKMSPYVVLTGATTAVAKIKAPKAVKP